MKNKIEIVNAGAFEYSKTATTLLSDLCDPFLKSIGLTTFLYGRVFNDGKFIMLSNNAEWMKAWFLDIPTIENTVLHTVFKNVPVGEPYYFLWDTDSKSNLLNLHRNLGVCHGFDISYRLEDSIEGWSFSTNQEHELINNFYFNNLKILHKFILYVREKAGFLFDVKNQDQLASFINGFDLSFQPSFIPTETLNELSSSLLLKSYTLKINNSLIKISRREIECVLHYSQGKTAKDIGRELDISPRTVEAYIKDVKLKTGCSSKSILADMLKNNVLKWF